MNKIVKIISSKIDDKKRRLIKSLGWGNDDVQETQVATAFGDDSHPVENLVAIYAPTSDIGNPVIIGYINKNQIAAVGEKRIFSTDADGTVVFAVHLKNDGTAEVGGNADNLVRYSELKSGFDALNDKVNSHISKYNSHIHPYIGLAVTVPGVTSPTASIETPSTADISGAKIDEIKTL